MEEGEASVDENESGADLNVNATEVEVGEEVGVIMDIVEGDELFDEDENVNDEILVDNENIEVDEAPLLDNHPTEPVIPVVKMRAGLVEHAAEPGGPAVRPRSTTTATGRKYFW